jgi:ribosomal protein S18 acetylase RimI-like enzyme
MGGITVHRATRKDARSIAGIHKQEITHGFLSTLPIVFLQKLYEAIITSSGGVCVVAKEKEEVVGFIAGTADIARLYRYFFLHYWFVSAVLLCNKLFQWRTVQKIWEVLRYPDKKTGQLPQAELLTIALSAKFQGKGVAGHMFELFTNEMKQHNIRQFKVLVGEELPYALRFYEKSGFRFHGTATVHGTEASRIYLYDVT